jgi:hypothetical protein
MKRLENALLAEFDSAEPMITAAERLHDDGLHVTTFSPHEIPHLAKKLGRGRTKLPMVVLIAGISGAAFAYWLQWYTVAVNYPLIVGARPPHSVPPFILITFETTVLLASCVGFVALFISLGLPRLWEPVAEIDGFERSTIDRFWVAVSRDDPHFDERRVGEALNACDPLRVVRLETKA